MIITIRIIIKLGVYMANSKLQSLVDFINCADDDKSSIKTLATMLSKFFQNNKAALARPVDNHGNTILHLAASQDKKNMVHHLVDKAHVPVDLTNFNGETSLITAVKNEHPRVVDMLISMGAQVNHAEKSGATALHYAVLNNCREIKEALLLNDANFYQNDKEGNSPFDYLLALAKIMQYDSKDWQTWLARFNNILGKSASSVPNDQQSCQVESEQASFTPIDEQGSVACSPETLPRQVSSSSVTPDSSQGLSVDNSTNPSPPMTSSGSPILFNGAVHENCRPPEGYSEPSHRANPQPF